MILRAAISIGVETAFRVGSIQCEFLPSIRIEYFVPEIRHETDFFVN